MKKIKFGIIGCSRIAARSTIPAIQSLKNSEVSIIGSRSKDKAQEFTKRFGSKSYGTYYDVLDGDVDAIYISLPIALQEKWAIMAAKKGKHVLCEKSATTSLKSAVRMVNACKDNDVRIMEGLVFKFHPQHKKVMEIIKKGSLGKIYTFYGRYGLPNPPKGDIRLSKELGGGVLNDAGCYPICASRMIFKEEPIEVTSNFVFDKEHKVDVRTYAFLKYPHSRVAFISAEYGVEYRSSYEVRGSKGIVSLKRAYSVSKDYTADVMFQSNDHSTTIKINPADQFQLMVGCFCNEISTKPTKLDFEGDMIKQAKVMGAIRDSYKKRKTITITE